MRVDDLEDLFTAAETLTCLKPVAGNELLIVTNGGGAGVLAVDDLVETGGSLAKLNHELIAKLDTILPATWSRANPIDIIGDATPDRYAATMEAVLDERARQRHSGDELPYGACLFHRCGGSGDRRCRPAQAQFRRAADPHQLAWR